MLTCDRKNWLGEFCLVGIQEGHDRPFVRSSVLAPAPDGLTLGVVLAGFQKEVVGNGV